MRQVTGFLAISMLMTAVADAANAQPQRPQTTVRRSQVKAVRVRPTRDGVQVAPAAPPPRIDPVATAAPPRLAEREAASGSDLVRIPWVPRRPQLGDFTADWSLPDGVRVGGFRQREPADGVPASETTLAYLSYDSENLYAAFVCRDERGKIRTHLTPREDIGGDDQVTVYLDTFRDGRHAYVFAANPSGIQQDGVIE